MSEKEKTFSDYNKFYKSEGYALTQPDIILGIVDYLFTACEQNMR